MANPYRDDITLEILWRGLRTHGRACTRCGSQEVRPSRTRPPLLGRALKMVAWRCENCFGRFVLRRPPGDA